MGCWASFGLWASSATPGLVQTHDFANKSEEAQTVEVI